MEKTMDKIVSLAKARGFVYPGSEIYGGLANTWDYGNLGVELKNNVKRAWWQKFVQENPYNVGVDCAILMNPQTWVASGHLGGFSDPLMDCKSCKERFRADKLIEDYMADNGIEIEGSVDAWSPEEMKAYVDEHNICCPSCGKHDFTDIRQFNLMFKTFQGDVYKRQEQILPSLRGSFDFIFMDAAKGQYIHWLPWLLRLMRPGAVLVSDNVLQEGDIIESRYAVERRNRTIHSRMREYLYTLKHMDELETAILPIGDGVAVSTRR